TGTAARVDKAAAELISALHALREEGKPLGEQFAKCMQVILQSSPRFASWNNAVSGLHDSLMIPLPHVRGTGPEFGAALAKVCYLANQALNAESGHMMGFSGLVRAPSHSNTNEFV